MKTWLWHWTEGGYNTVRAETREEALKLAIEKGKPTKHFGGLQVNEKTLHEASDEEVAEIDKRYAGMFY